MKWTATFAAAALSAALCAAPTANEDFVVAEAAAAYSNAVYTAGTNTAAVADTLSASLTSCLSLASRDATNYTDAASAALSAADAVVARDATNYTDSASAALSAADAVVARDATNYTDAASAALSAADAVVARDATNYTDKVAAALSAADAVVACDATNYTDKVAAALSAADAVVARDATNYTDSAIGAAIAPANPTFSEAVLSVGLNIDTNAVAVLNEIAADFGGFPLSPGSTATTVGGLLAALAAAIAWLKKNKADASALRYAFAATIQPTAGTAAPTGELTDRAEIKVVCTEATGQTGNNAKLTLTLPPAVPGYVRDFLVKIDRTTSGCYSVDFVPYGDESVSYETADGSMPEVPDGAVTWLSFTESESGGVFAVRATPLVAVTGGV